MNRTAISAPTWDWLKLKPWRTPIPVALTRTPVEALFSTWSTDYVATNIFSVLLRTYALQTLERRLQAGTQRGMSLKRLAHDRWGHRSSTRTSETEQSVLRKWDWMKNMLRVRSGAENVARWGEGRWAGSAVRNTRRISLRMLIGTFFYTFILHAHFSMYSTGCRPK